MSAEIEVQIPAGRRTVWWPQAAAVLLLGACTAYGTAIYDSLPETVPTHWGATGAPDAWDAKSVSAVFLPLIMGAGVCALLALVSAAVPMMSPADPRASQWEQLRREGMIRGTVGALGATSFLMAALISYLSVTGWEQPEHVPSWPALMVTGLVLLALIGSFRAANRWARRTAADHGVSPSQEEEAEDALWIAGILYNDPGDPHVLVSKRKGTGTGITVNVGNPKGRAVVVVFLIVAVLLPAALGLFAAL